LLVWCSPPRRGRPPSRPPVFQVMFIWDKPGQATSGRATTPDGLELEPLVMEQRGAPFDLTLIVFEEGERLTASLRYNADLFDPATVARWAGHFDTLLAAVSDALGRPLADVPMLTPAERRLVIDAPNATAGPFPDGCAFHQLVEQQVARAPDALAVEFEGVRLTYRELNARANRLARRLQALGVRRGDVVGISLPRGAGTVIAVLAAWKARA